MSEMEWTNTDTWKIAEAIRTQDREFGNELWQGVADVDRETAIKIEAESIRGWFCGIPEAGVDPDEPELVEIAGIDLGKVDWRQIAEWLIAKSEKTKPETE
jgi:hypothetical protein